MSEHDHKNNDFKNEMGEEAMEVIERPVKKNLSRAEKIARIRKNSPLIRKVDGAFEVNENNPEHRAWFIDKE